MPTILMKVFLMNDTNLLFEKVDQKIEWPMLNQDISIYPREMTIMNPLSNRRKLRKFIDKHTMNYE